MKRHSHPIPVWRCMPRAVAWLFAIALVALGASVPAVAVEVRAWLDRDTMHLGETVTLNIEADSSLVAQPDFSALAQDFNQLGSQSSRSVNIVNGSSSAKTVWAVGLEPRHAGRITIPAIEVGSAHTDPLVLTVLPAAAGAQGRAGDDVFLAVSADPATPYVQQQVRYTVKLYYAFNLTNGDLGEPQADGLVSERLGQDRNYLAELGGRRYHVVERHYALIPERSGELTIPAIAFRGSALDASDPTGFFSRGRSVGARSDPITLDVRPRPAGWSGAAWLPAADLTLQDESPPPTEVHVGDPITRTIRLQAKGLGYEQLPEITLPAVDGAETYPDKAQTRTRDDGTWIYGERVRKFAFVPSRPGTLTIPGISVRWWNTARDEVETTTLPAQTVTVLPAGDAPDRSPAAAPRTTAPTTAVPGADRASAVAAPQAESGSNLHAWQVLAALGLFLWLATLALFWWWQRRTRARRAAPDPRSGIADGNARARFLRSCSLGDHVGAERALLAWARAERPRLHNLGEVAARLGDSAQRDALSELARVRYAGARSDGLAQRLERAFKGGFGWNDAGLPRATTDEPLPPLYPPRA